jgi:Fe-Mn family superoxide dismutase
MTPNGGGLPTGDLLAAIEATFGTLKNLKQVSVKAGATQFGSLVRLCARRKVEVCGTPNQDNP